MSKLRKLGQLYVSFFKVGGLTFGGGLSMLPMLEREVIKNRHWATEDELLDMYAIGQCTPGIIAVNVATYVGYKQAGFIGGVVATLGEISPSILIISLVASILQNFITMPQVQHALAGIRIAVCAMMLNTLIGLIRRGVVDVFGGVLFAIAFILACFTPVPTVVVIILAGVSGVLASLIKERWNKKKGGESA